MFRFRKPQALALYLAAVIAALAIPLFAMTAVATYFYVQAEKGRLEQFAANKLDHIVDSLEQDFNAKILLLEEMTTTPSLRKANFEQFDMRARELLPKEAAYLVLRGANGRQLVNTFYPAGAQLPTDSNSEADDIVFQTRQPHVSSLIAAEGGDLAVTISVPVIEANVVTSVLSVVYRPAYFANLMSQSGLAAPYFASIADRTGRIVARTVRSEEFVGKQLPGFGTSRGASGSYAGRNPQGVAVLGFYKRLQGSGWFISIGIEKAAMEAPLSRSLAIMSLIFLALAISGAALVWRIARVITGAFKTLLEAIAVRMSGREIDVAPTTPILEANVVGTAIAAASRKISEQTGDLLRSKQELERRVEQRTRELADQAALMQATLENMDQGLFMVDASGSIAIHNDRADELLSLPAALLDGKPHYRELVAFQQGIGEFSNADQVAREWKSDDPLANRSQRYVRERRDGRVLDVRSVPISTGGMVCTFSDITEQHRAAQRISHIAHHDALTGLGNRLLFRERLEQAFRSAKDHGSCFAVLLIDLDRFKLVNDALGDSAGDTLIKIVAARLAELIGEGDTVSRLGGDEFALIRIVDRNHAEDATKLASKFLASLQSRIQLGGRETLTTASIGIVIAPGDGIDAENILKHADLALAKAKSDGRNRFTFFESGMEREAEERHTLELEMRQALERGEFAVHYQPVINSIDQRICGFEALVRWHHPERGMVSPMTFIPLAEETGIVVPLGEWVLRQACMDAASWPSNIKIAVNLSPVQLLSEGLVATIESALAMSGLAAERLELEVTETVLLQKDDRSLGTLHGIQNLGVAVVLDDFGTGYSSLSYVRAFPFDKIKIDKSFVDEMETRPECAAIITAVTGLARMLDMSITAEGVETEQQFQLLRAAGCGQAQGYLFSRPRPQSEFSFDAGGGCFMSAPGTRATA
jgi:diguanylate cyclase (GGDEF)-like protein